MTAIYINIEQKSYAGTAGVKTQNVIQDLALTLESQQFACLVGPSGCGKTTLLNMIAGLDRVFDGQIVVSDDNRKPRISYVFQSPRLLPWRTVRENIELVCGDADHIDTLLDILGLSNAQHEYPQRLSLGMERRVALARAFSVEADLLLMDEPFVSLDAPTARKIRELVFKLWQQRPHTILFVTHDLREAIELADRLLLLSPSPAQITADIAVTLPREQRFCEDELEQYRKQLLHEHPEIQV